MKTLKKAFRIKLIRYNLGKPALGFTKIVHHDPTEDDLIEFLEECNKDSQYKDFETTIEVELFYAVVNQN